MTAGRMREPRTGRGGLPMFAERVLPDYIVRGLPDDRHRRVVRIECEAALRLVRDAGLPAPVRRPR